MKLYRYLILILLSSQLGQAQNNSGNSETISNLIDSWHKAAADANFDSYFNLMTDDAIFIGTDAMENWNKEEFKKYSKPHFDKGKAWNFTSVQRNIYFSADQKIAWFGELLDTQMKICRGSGVLVKVKNKWKIAHYVLSISIPNELSKDIIKLKTDTDDVILERLKK